MSQVNSKPTVQKWRATGTVVAGTYIGEFTGTREEAEAKAWKRAYVSVCHQCGKHISDPEVEEIHLEPVEDEGPKDSETGGSRP